MNRERAHCIILLGLVVASVILHATAPGRAEGAPSRSSSELNVAEEGARAGQHDARP